MILVLLGPPGAGKGTQGAQLVATYGLPKISTGEMFRDLAASGSELGVQAKSYWAKGMLVPDQIVVDLLEERIQHEDCRSGFILDGFPRTVRQADTLTEVLQGRDMAVDAVLNFTVSDAELIRRLEGRRNCANCGATYHLTARPPMKANICDHCGSELQQRRDDNPESIRIRLGEYCAKTEPLLEYYERRGLLHTVRAEGAPEGIFREVRHAVSAMRDAQALAGLSGGRA